MHKKLIIIIIVFIVIIGGGAGAWFYFSKAPDNGSGQKVIMEINPEELVIFEVKLDNLSDYQKDQAFKRFTNAKNTISQNKEDGLANEDNANFYAWLEIASVQKLIGDYDRAIKIWTWFTEIYSGNSISPANLGDLYKSFVVDKEKSEKYYKIALEREKHDFQIYYGFYELYRYVFDDADKAIAVLQDGMANNPDRKDYLTELINYLISLDRRDQASAVIENWIAQHPEDFSLKARLQ